MVALCFALIAAAAAAVFAFCSGSVTGLADIWKVLLFFIGAFLAVVVLYLLYAALICLSIDRKNPLEKQSKHLKVLCEMAASLVCTFLFIRPTAAGTEKLPGSGRFLLVCNHLSGYDPLVTIKLLRKYNVFFVMKPSIFRFPLVGTATYGAGCIAIDRQNNREALKSIIQAADYLKRGLCSICIYPEGTRSRTGALGDFHPGSFKIAQKAGVPIAVACIEGTEKVRKNVLRRVTDVTLSILEVIPSETAAEMRTVDLAEHSRSLILKHQGESCGIMKGHETE